MKLLHRVFALFLVLALSLTLVPIQAFAEETADTEYTSTVLFTHDMHSHLLPTTNSDGSETGGFARLATLLKQQRELYPDALTLDGGDFSMGSLFQAIYASDAAELRLMGAMGYDATTFGNHEFDYRQSGLASMLEAAVASGDTLPMLLEANYALPDENDEDYDEDDAAVAQALEDYGVQSYTLIERGGITYGIFGIMGVDCDADAPTSGMILADAVETAQEIVNQIKSEADPDQPLFIICLSHSVTRDDV